jgi:hypothetical protein
MDAHAKWTGKRGNAALSKGFARTGVLAPSRSVWTAAYSAAFDHLTTSFPNHPRAMNSIGRNRANPAQPYLPPGPDCNCPPETPATPCTQPLHGVRVHASRFTFHAIVTSKLHHLCTVSAPIFENAFHYSLSPNPLQKPIRKMVQFLACRAETLGKSGLTFLPKLQAMSRLPNSTALDAAAIRLDRRGGF